jgi:hypothetical protein
VWSSVCDEAFFAFPALVTLGIGFLLKAAGLNEVRQKLTDLAARVNTFGKNLRKLL